MKNNKRPVHPKLF